MKSCFPPLSSLVFTTAAVLTLAASSMAEAQTSVSTWAQSYGVGVADSSGNQTAAGFEYPTGIAPMPDGGVVVTGQLDLPSNTYHGVGGSGPTILVRYRADGATLWQVRTAVLNDYDELLGDPANNTPGPVIVSCLRTDTQGNIYVSGTKEVGDNGGYSRPFVAKFDANGALLWQNSLGDIIYHRVDSEGNPYTNSVAAGDTFSDFTITPDGGVVACTSVTASLYNAIHNAPLVARFGPDGTQQHVFAFDYPGQGTDIEPAYTACQSLDGSRYLVMAPSGGATVPGPDGNPAYTPSTGILTDASGTILAQRLFYVKGSPFGDVPAQVYATADGGWIVYSQANDLAEAALRKLRADLTPVWEKFISVPAGGGAFNASPFLTLTADGGFLLSGRINGPLYGNVLGGYELGSGDVDVLLLKLDASGNLQNAWEIGGPAQEGFGFAGFRLVGVPQATQTADGGFAFTTPTTSYTTPPGANQPSPDWWTVKTDPNGRLQGFGDVLASLPLSLFSVVDNNAESMPGGNFITAGSNSTYPAVGYSGVTNDPTPTMTAGTFNPTGDDLPSQRFQAGSFTGPVLPVTTNFAAQALSALGAGQPITFSATQPSPAEGLSVRVQASTTPLLEGSWTTLPDGTMQATGPGRWTLTTTSAPFSADTSRPYFFRAVASAPGYHDSVSMFDFATLHPAFFSGEAALGQGTYYLAFASGNPFGYYSYLSDPHYIYHFDLGYEYGFDAADNRSGIYFYDFKSGGFFYTSPGFPFPYLYDFTLNTVLYYYPNPTDPTRYNTDGVRYFYNFSTGTIINK